VLKESRETLAVALQSRLGVANDFHDGRPVGGHVEPNVVVDQLLFDRIQGRALARVPDASVADHALFLPRRFSSWAAVTRVVRSSGS
jgi:hypothetical protein